jgi:hypothetical protein
MEYGKAMRQVISEISELAKMLFVKAESLNKLQSAFIERSAFKTEQFDKKLAGLKKKSDTAKIAKLVEQYEGKYDRMKKKYVNELVSYADVMLKRKHFSKLFLESWEAMDVLATDAFNSFVDLDADITHLVNVDLSPLQVLHDKLAAEGSKLQPLDHVFLPKELNILRRAEHKSRKQLLCMPSLDAAKPEQNTNSTGGAAQDGDFNNYELEELREKYKKYQELKEKLKGYEHLEQENAQLRQALQAYASGAVSTAAVTAAPTATNLAPVTQGDRKGK